MWCDAIGIAKYNNAGRDIGKQASASIWAQTGALLLAQI